MNWYDDLFDKMESLRDPQQAEKMAAYMKNQFFFLGLPKPVRYAAVKPCLQKVRKTAIDWDFVAVCWEKPYREAQYAAIEYLSQHEKQMEKGDLDKLKKLITTKSWWETTDSLDSLCGALVMRYPELKQTMLEWSVSGNLWLRRTAIDCQQKWKENTDTELLRQVILNNLGSSAFFINKAIGWSLREYSKVNAPWVRDFMAEVGDRLAPLSRKEGSRYL